MNEPNFNAPSATTWWPLAAVCRPIGLTPHVFLAACQRGEIPIRVQSFGARGLWFCLRVDVLAYMRSFLPAEGTDA